MSGNPKPTSLGTGPGANAGNRTQLQQSTAQIYVHFADFDRIKATYENRTKPQYKSDRHIHALRVGGPSPTELYMTTELNSNGNMKHSTKVASKPRCNASNASSARSICSNRHKQSAVGKRRYRQRLGFLIFPSPSRLGFSSE